MQAFGLFAQIDVMTRGGPVDATQTMVFQAVERGYRKQDIAAGSVISVVLFLIVLTISLVQRYLTREKKLMATVERQEPDARPHAGGTAPGPRSGGLRLPAPVHGRCPR